MKTILYYFFFFLFSTTIVQAQEDCFNGIDDDGDGLIDFEDPDCDPSFPCNGNLYQVISGVLKIFDPLSSTYTDLGPSGIGSYNAAGFNVQDNFIYAIATISGGKHVIKLGQDGVAIDQGEVSNFSGASYRADIDTLGNWISYEGGNNPTLRVIDLDVYPLTMQTIPLTNLFGASIPACADITYNPVTNKMFGMSGAFQLIEIDLYNETVDVTMDFDGGGGGFGAAWSDSEGNSYFSNNPNGEIFRVRFDESGVPFEMKKVAQGIVTNNNDGMNCVLALPPFETDCSDGIDNDGDGLIDSEDPDCTEVPEFEVVDIFDGEMTNSWGITFVDYNKDSYEDVFIPSYSDDASSSLYINQGDGTFEKSTSGDFLSVDASCLAGTWADINNDGYVDLATANNTGSDNQLFMNNNFDLELSDLASLPNSEGYSHGITFLDIDNDGALDIFVSDFFETKFNQLYRNLGDGSFEKVTTGEIAIDASKSIGAVTADVNLDGFVDIFVPNYGGENSLYINQGDGSFTRVGMGDDATSTGGSFGDYDNDGDMDLFVANAASENNILYKNDGAGNFEIVDGGYISIDGGDSHGSSWADLNKDGWIDLYVTNDRAGAKLLYMNNGDGTFGKSIVSNLISPIGNSFSTATADYDNDGDLDIVVATHSGEENFLFRNAGNGNNYINVLLEGTNSNWSAIGAKMFVTAVIDGVSVTQYREVTAQTGGGPGSQDSFYQFVGLGDATEIEEIRIEWPSGYEQVETGININQKITIVEDNSIRVSGRVYQDFTGNCVFDGDDYGLGSYMLSLNNGEQFVVTDEDGFYEMFVAVGSHELSAVEDEKYDVNCPSNNSHSFTASFLGQEVENRDFSLSATDLKSDCYVDLGLTALRRGFENEMLVSYGNQGTAIAYNCKLKLELTDEITLASSGIEPTSVDGNIYTWDLGDLEIGESATIDMKNYVSLETTLGQFKNMAAKIETDSQEWDLLNNCSLRSEEIVGALDPNDIAVSPRGFGIAHMIRPTDTLTYRIRFQNVGNYPASRIVVVDTLPASVDVKSLKMGAISHDYEFKISDQRILTWTFNDINLPDSTANEEASHGFIQFEIVPNADVVDRTRIENSAAIQFDFNLPVITNTVFNTINYDWSGVDVSNSELFVAPNPVQDELQIYLHEGGDWGDNVFMEAGTDGIQSGIALIQIFDSKGRVVKSLELNRLSHELVIPVYELKGGLYVVRSYSRNGEILTAKMIKK